MCNCNVPNLQMAILGGSYGITIKQIHPLMNLMIVWFFIHPLTNLMLHDFHSSINEPNVCIIFHKFINLLMSFVTKCLVMGSNVVVQ
jgi:hypothetical protein